MRRRGWQLAQIALTVGVLGFLYHDAGKRNAMADALAKADWNWIAAGIAIGLVGEAAGIIRWRMFLTMQDIQVGLGKTARWFFIGLFFNMFLPGTTGGDLARLYYLWHDFPQQRRGAVLTLVADRLIGLIPLIVAAGIATAFNFRWLTQTPATAGLLYCMLAFCTGMALIILLSFALCGRKSFLPNWVPWRGKIENLTSAWGFFIQDRGRFFWTLLLSVPVLFSYYGGFYCASRAVNSGARLGEMFSIMPIVTIITSLPVSVAGLGVREGLFEKLLGDLCGTPQEVAALVSLLGFTIFVLFGLVGAVVYLFSPVVDRRELAEMDVSTQPAK